MTGWRDIGKLALTVGGSEALGAAGALGGGDIRSYYDELSKPPLSPPPAVFGPAWGTLYLLMGIAAWLVWKPGVDRRTGGALGLYVAQLLLNTGWSLIFFGARRRGLALLEIAALWATILATMVAFWRVRPLAGLLLVPYFAWVSFAAYLNAGVYRLNRSSGG